MILSLDLETTGLVPGWHRSIQIGMVSEGGAEFKMDICQPLYTPVSEESLQVNGFTRERIKAGVPFEEAQDLILDWMDEHGYKQDIMLLGYNVMSFDLQFMHEDFPTVAERFSHRGIDLTGLTWLLAELEGRNWRELKDELHKTVLLPGEADERHDALFDARQSWRILREIKSRLSKNL